MLSRQTNKLRSFASVLRCIRHQSSFNLQVGSENLPVLEPEYASTVVHGRGIHPPIYHPKTHNIPVALVHFRSYTPEQLDLMTHFASHAASALGVPISKTAFLPTQRSLWTVLRGPFAHKKSQENFERRVHKRAIKAWDADPEVVNKWLKYLQKHVVPGVGLRFTRWERGPVGVGEYTFKNVREQMALDLVTSSQKVKALGEKIVETELAAEAMNATNSASEGTKS